MKTLLATALTCMLATAAFAQSRLVTPSYLLEYPTGAMTFDYRAAINANATQIVFERSSIATGNEPTSKANGGYQAAINLYIAPINSPSSAVSMLVSASMNMQSNRPDWCWSSTTPSRQNSIVFSSPKGIFYTGPNPEPGGPLTMLPATNSSTVYPTWYPGCSALAIYVNGAITFGPPPYPNNASFSNPGPAVGKYVIGQEPSSEFLTGKKLWAGFATINYTDPSLLVVAAQKFTGQGYNQDLNYIYIANTAANPPRVTPLEPEAPVNNFSPLYQGRAPAWSPDGKWIAFESNRNCSFKGFYSIFVINSAGLHPPKQVTSCGYNAQHAKWYPTPQNGRTLLIASVRLYPHYEGTSLLKFSARGIASLDVTDFITPRSER